MKTPTEEKHSRRFLHRPKWQYLLLATIIGGLVAASTASANAGTPGSTMTGRAYGITAKLGLLGQPPSTLISPVPDTGLVVTDQSRSVTPACANVPAQVIVVQALCTSVVTHANTSRVAASAKLADLKIAVPGLPAIELRGVKGWSTVTCGSSHGTTTVAFLKIGNQSIISRRVTFSNGATFNIGPIKIVFNEVTKHGPPTRARLVNAVHITANVPNVAFLDVIASSAFAGVTDCPTD